MRSRRSSPYLESPGTGCARSGSGRPPARRPTTTMTNLPTALRVELAGAVPFSTLARREAAGARRHREGAVPHGRRPPGRGGADALSGRPPLGLPVRAVRLPADVHVLRDRRMRFGRNLTASEILDQALHFRRARAARPLCVHGHGRADDEPRRRSSRRAGVSPTLGVTHRRTAISTVGWLPGLAALHRESTCRSGSRSHSTRRTTRCARSSCRSTTATRSPTCSRPAALPRAPAPQGLRRVRDARGRERPRRAGAALAALLDPRVYKVNLIPYNPTGAFEGSSPEAIAAFKAGLERAGLARHRTADARPRHRGRLRPARRGRRRRDTPGEQSRSCWHGLLRQSRLGCSLEAVANDRLPSPPAPRRAADRARVRRLSSSSGRRAASRRDRAASRRQNASSVSFVSVSVGSIISASGTTSGK